MSPADWFAAAAAVFAGASTIGGAVYMRRRLDAHAESAKTAIDGLGAKIDKLETARLSDAEEKGAQQVQNAKIEVLSTDVRLARDLSVKTEARQNEHEKGCDRRQAEIERSFTEVRGALDHMAAEIRNLALGLANNVRELPPNRASQR